MPQIKEYTQQVGSQGGFLTTSINPSIEGGAGRAMQQVGQAVENVGKTIYDIQQSKETAEASSDISQIRLKYTQRVLDEVNTGTLSLDKLSADYDAELQQVSQKYNTRGASEYLRKSSMALKDSLAMDALKAESEITAVKIKNSALKNLDAAQQTLVINPTKLADVKNQFRNDVMSLTINGKLIDAKIAEKIISDGSKQLDVAQFRGLIYASRVEDLPKLKAALEAGHFSDRQFADEDFRKMRQEIDSEYKGRLAAKRDELSLIKEQREAAKDNEKNKFLIDRISQERKYTVMDIARSNVLDPDEKMALISKIEGIASKVDKNAANSIVNDAYRKMLLPDGDPNKIVSQEQVLEYAKYLPAEKANWLLGRFMASKTPAEKANAKLKSTFYNAAKKALGIDPLSKIVDPKAEAQLSDLINDFETQYAARVAEGIAPAELLTQSGKNSLYPLIENYRRGLNERLSDLSKGLKSGKQGQPPVKQDGTKMSPAEYLQMKKQQQNQQDQQGQ